MLAITRKQAIKKLLQEQKSVTISDLSERLNVTKETIRRDLRAMEKDQELIRTHGGAYILEGVQNDLDVITRQALRITEKEIIAQKCDALIQPSDIIFLDSSTTSWYIARKIVNRKLTVVTTSLEIANILHVLPLYICFLQEASFPQEPKDSPETALCVLFSNIFLTKHLFRAEVYVWNLVLQILMKIPPCFIKLHFSTPTRNFL